MSNDKNVDCFQMYYRYYFGNSARARYILLHFIVLTNLLAHRLSRPELVMLVFVGVVTIYNLIQSYSVG